MTKKITALVLAMLLIVSSFAGCSLIGGEKEIRVGTSDIYITIPASYEKGPMSIEDTDEGQVAYYKSDKDLIDFDLYHWAKATDENLASAVAEETENEIKSGKFGEADFLYYNDVEEADGESYPTTTYVTENGDYFVEFVFWADGADAMSKIEKMMNTVKVKKSTPKTGENLIQLGTSDLYVTTPVAFTKGEMTREDTDLCQVAYYLYDDASVDFDVYYWAKGDGETLESTAALEEEEFSVKCADREINGIKTKYYNATEEIDGETYTTTTYIIDDGDYLAELVFWLDGDKPEDTVESIISSLTK